MQELLLHRRRRLGLLGGEPHRAAPHAVGAERHAGRELATPADAAGGEHGHRSTASTTSGTSTIVAISPVWPPASVPWATIRSAPAASCRAACSTVPASAATGMSAPCARSMKCGGGGPSAEATSRVSCANSTSSSGAMLFGSMRMPPTPASKPVVLWQRRHVVAREQVVDERLVLVGHEAAERAAVEAAFFGAGELLGHEQVDAVRLALHLLLDPREVDVELLGAVRDARRARRSRRRW